MDFKKGVLKFECNGKRGLGCLMFFEKVNKYGFLTVYSLLKENDVKLGEKIKYGDVFEFQLTDRIFRFCCEMLEITFIEFTEEQMLKIKNGGNQFLKPIQINDQNFEMLGENGEQTSGKILGLKGFEFIHSQINKTEGSIIINGKGVIGMNKKDINGNMGCAMILDDLDKIFNKILRIDKNNFSSVLCKRDLREEDYPKLKEIGIIPHPSIKDLWESPRSPGITSIWFYRTNWGWLWSPSNISEIEKSITNCNWMPITCEESLYVKGGIYHGFKPATRNIQLIETLIEQGKRFIFLDRWSTSTHLNFSNFHKDLIFTTILSIKSSQKKYNLKIPKFVLIEILKLHFKIIKNIFLIFSIFICIHFIFFFLFFFILQTKFF